MSKNDNTSISGFWYSVLKFPVSLISRFLYHPQILRNALKDAQGAYVVLANHESALDFVNIAGLTKRKQVFVLSRTYYNSMPAFIRYAFDKINVINKQQFQTAISDLKKMYQLVQQGHGLILYPAGLMCEDGLSTPVPEATGRFLKWLKTDVYVAKTAGAYFVMPKWSGKIRPGKTTMDVYRLFTAEEIKKTPLNEINIKIEDALHFDAYEDQEKLGFEYRHGDNAEGLENVVYQCPHCDEKYNMSAENNRLFCRNCGFSQTMDKKGFLHCEVAEKEIRCISDWTKAIMAKRRKEITQDFEMRLHCRISLMDGSVKGFRDAGEGTVILNADEMIIDAVIDGDFRQIKKGISEFPILPFVPGKQFEIQDGLLSYRCYPDDPRVVMEWINTLKILHENWRNNNDDK